MKKIISILFLGFAFANIAAAQTGERTPQTAAPKSGTHAPAPQELPTGIDAAKQAGQNSDGAKSANRRNSPAPQELPNAAGEKGGQKKSTTKVAVQELPNG